MKFILILSTALFCTNSILAQTPIVHFQFNTTFKDTGLNKLSGTPYGGVGFTADKFGTPNKACYFDGTDDYIDLGTTNTLKPTSLITLAIWAHSDNWSGFTTSPTLIGNTEDGGYGLMINNNNGEFEAKVFRKNAYGTAGYALNKISSGWHHFALTYTAGITSLYLDGKLVDSNFIANNPLISYSFINNNTVIGDEAASGLIPEGKRFKGKIDDIRYYFYAMTELQMQALYSTSSGIFSDIVIEKQNYIYPNPVQEIIKIQAIENLSGTISLDVLDISGRLIHTFSSHEILNESTVIRPSFINKGLYIINIKEHDKIIAHQYVSFE